jgi:hypothetical protein
LGLRSKREGEAWLLAEGAGGKLKYRATMPGSRDYDVRSRKVSNGHRRRKK